MFNWFSKMLSVFSKPIPFYAAAVLLLFSTVAGYLMHPATSTDASGETRQPPCTAAMETIRQWNYEFTRPLLLADVAVEDNRMIHLKASLSRYVNERIAEGILTTASVYVRKVNNGAWISVNDSERYSPGSLLKVPLLIYYLKEAEKNPAILKRRIYFSGHFDVPRAPIFTSKGLTPGTSYPVEELLRFMAVYSDNDATVLLDGFADRKAAEDIYEELGLRRPDPTQRDYSITVQEAARFFRILYNATYLTPAMSDYALKLLAQSSFEGGIVKPLGQNIHVPRKFAERGTGDIKQFHEVGIVYLETQAYLLGVMTKGHDLQQLSDVVSDISETVYDEMRTTNASF